MTKTITNRTFRTKLGALATVYHVRGVEKRGFMAGMSKTLRTYVEVDGVQIDIETGCGYKAEAAVAHL